MRRARRAHMLALLELAVAVGVALWMLNAPGVFPTSSETVDPEGTGPLQSSELVQSPE